ncbi:uncharacterized protein G2W53_036510 [Senna tora]|uniref:Uncharacterized protein n=1 Tax=Senna tora TaxID=362788 RepID=A0A834W561_9FABA|nr:uncharacterized protein G2W53_036510 [Senna tora]
MSTSPLSCTDLNKQDSCCSVISNSGSYCTTYSYEAASSDALFLWKLSIKREGDKEWDCPFASAGLEYMGNRPNASYRQQYLRMYNPMKKMRKDSLKDRTKKWLIKIKANTASQSSSIVKRFVKGLKMSTSALPCTGLDKQDSCCSAISDSGSYCTTYSYEAASSDALFLWKLSIKREGDKEWDCPFASAGLEYMGNRPNASYRQQYLRMYNPMKKMRKDSLKDRTKKWLIKIKANTTSQSSSIVKRFVKVFQAKKRSHVTPIQVDFL